MQAYKLTHFYEHGTVMPIEEQASGFWGKTKVALLGLKQEKLVGTLPDSVYTNVRLKTASGLTLAAWYIHMPNAKGTVALFHGLGSEKSANLSQSNFFNEMGYSTCWLILGHMGKVKAIPVPLVTGKQKM
ncbi:MAG: hypothetical protein WDM90_19870 [Ferruginibacter sp.]